VRCSVLPVGIAAVRRIVRSLLANLRTQNVADDPAKQSTFAAHFFVERKSTGNVL
jgi:hypothetical protein